MDEPNSRGDALVRRAPVGFLWNQAFSFWQFFSLFLYQLVITRALSPTLKGVYEQVLTPANFAVYLAALGLESAGAVYLPRALAEGGPGRALAVALRLVAVRILAVALVAAGVLWGLPALASLLAGSRVPGTADLARHLNDPALLAHRLALAAYVVGVGLANLMAALLTAVLRTRVVFLVGSLGQLASIGLAVALVAFLHGGPDAAVYALALPNALLAGVYLFALRRILAAPLVRMRQRVLGPMLRLGSAAWLADLANGSLVKLLAVAQLTVVAAPAQVAFFGIAFEMGHAASFLFVAGLGGVGLAVMSAAYVGRQTSHLATAWRTISKVQMLLAVPLVAFLVPHADVIVQRLYGVSYASAGTPLALFLGLNLLVRLGGGGASEAALYVLGRQRWVVVARWGSLVVLGLGDLLLIPRYGVTGALVAVGVAQLAAEAFELVLARVALTRPYPAGFMVRVLAALAPALAFSVLWRPDSLPGLVVAGLAYTAIFLVALRLLRPLDAEDAALLTHGPPALRAILRPFAAPFRGMPPPIAPLPARDHTPAGQPSA